MNLGKRLGISDDILKAATEVLEGKKITHPNQRAISAAAPPEDEITSADFKALKAKKRMHRVEGFDRNKRHYESPLFETYEEAMAFLNKIRKSSPLTNLKITQFQEEEQIDELDRSTMASYVDKADKDRIKRQRETPVNKRDAKFYSKNNSRLTGINRAVDKLNKEEVEQVEEAMKPYVSYTAARPGRAASATVMGADGKPHKTFTKDDHGHDYKEQAMGYFKAMVAKRSKMEESKELNKKNSDDEREHDCAKHVIHEQWGAGETVPTMHAEPDTAGNIAWYDIMFEHGIEQQVPVSDLEITLSETHVHKKSKRMTEAEEHGKKKAPKKGEAQVEFNPEYKKEEVESVDEMDKSMAYATGTKRAMQMTGDEPPLEKSTIKKAHKIAKAMLRKEDVEQIDEKMSEFEKLAARRAWQKNPANKGKPLPTHLQTDQQKQKAAAKSADMKMTTKEEVDTLDEGRKAGVVGSVLSSPAAREHFKKLTGKEPSYFHISKNPDHAQAALNHAAKAKAPEGEAPEAGEEDSDTEANKHPINQLRGIADRGRGKFMGKDITRAHANKLISMHNDLKPAQRLDFVSNIGKHLAKVIS